MAKFGTTSCQADLWSDVPPVHQTPNAPMPCPNPPVGTSHGHIRYYFGQADLWSDVSPCPQPPSTAPPNIALTPNRDISWPSLVLLLAG